jgi:hypothetical protein
VVLVDRDEPTETQIVVGTGTVEPGAEIGGIAVYAP